MRTGPTTLGLAALLCTGTLVAAGAPASAPEPQPEPQPAPQPAAPELGVRAVIERTSGRVTYRPLGVRRWRVLTSKRVALRFGARVDATAGRVVVTVARNKSGARSHATFSRGVFRLAKQERVAPYVATLSLTGPSFESVCGEQASASRRARKRSKRRVRRLWGDGKGRYRTRGRYSAATVRGTKWLTEDRCDGTLTRVARGEVEVEDFTQTERDAPEPTPVPQSGGGGGDTGAEAPAAAPQPERQTSRRKRVRVRKGKSYRASPND